MEPKIMADPVKDKRKPKGGGTMKTNDRVHPPDKKKFERETAEINRQIKELEAKLKATQTDITPQSIHTELSKVQTELGEMERMRGANKTEVKKIEERLRSLGEEVIKKKNEASSLLAGMRCNSESKIDEMISKLRGMLTRQLSDSDLRKYKHEIATLEKSKLQLGEFTKAKEAAEKMRSEQDDLRKRRDSCYCRSKELKEEEMKAKDRMTELRSALAHAKEKKRETIAQKDTISKEINALYEQRRQLHTLFREQQAAYEKERRKIREEEERKRREDRQALQEAMFQRKLDQEMLRCVRYDEDIATAKALLFHLQANASGTSSYFGGEGESPSSSTTNLDAPEGAAAGGTISSRDSAINQKPGEFVRKKDTEEEVLVPAKWTMVRRKSKREKRRSTVPKRLYFNPAIFQQFSHLGIQPPSSHAEIPAIISKLQEKLTFYESKSKNTLGVPAYSEAGDSGVGGMTDAEISQVQSVATSQEDLHLITVSPNTSVTDLKLPFPLQPPASASHPSDNNDDPSDNKSSQTIVEEDESSTPRSNSSLMATAVSS